jgi:predicted amidohydrolase
MEHIRAASVQFNHVAGDKDANLRRIGEFVADASAHTVDLVVFPEMCITGYWHVRNLSRRDVDALAEPVPGGPSTQALIELARDSGMTIGAGLIERDAAGALYNGYVVAMPNGQVACHRKIHCFISEHMASGEAFTVFDMPQAGSADAPPAARLGVLTCYDNNIVENARITALMGADVVLAPHQTGGCNSPSPGAMGLIDPKLWEDRERNPVAIEAEFRGHKGRGWLMRWLPARAHDNGVFLIFSNGVGLDDGEVRTGNAMILDPYGEVLVETWKARDDMVVADLDPVRLENCTGRRWIRSRRPDLYSPLTVPTGQETDTRTLRFARQAPE